MSMRHMLNKSIRMGRGGARTTVEERMEWLRERPELWPKFDTYDDFVPVCRTMKFAGLYSTSSAYIDIFHGIRTMLQRLGWNPEVE